MSESRYHPEPCADCGAKLRLIRTKYGLFYGCTQFARVGCKGGVGAHPDGTPLGPPATAEVRAARKAAHDAFDRLWRGGDALMGREHAYVWLARKLHVEEAHIAWLGTVEDCERVVALVEAKLAGGRRHGRNTKRTGRTSEMASAGEVASRGPLGANIITVRGGRC